MFPDAALSRHLADDYVTPLRLPQDRGEALSLQNYMTLPIEQYDEVRLCFAGLQLPRLVPLAAVFRMHHTMLGAARSMDRRFPAHSQQLDPDMIKSLGGNRYSLAVPRTSLFSVWVEPIVEVEVNLALTGVQRAVIIQVTSHTCSAPQRSQYTIQDSPLKCILQGSSVARCWFLDEHTSAWPR